jgi:hypothetical protein
MKIKMMMRHTELHTTEALVPEYSIFGVGTIIKIGTM